MPSATAFRMSLPAVPPGVPNWHIANDKDRHCLLISRKTFLSQSFSPGFASVWPTLPKYPRLLDDEVWGDEGSSVTLLLDGPEVWLEAEIKRFDRKYASLGDQKPPHLFERKLTSSKNIHKF